MIYPTSTDLSSYSREELLEIINLTQQWASQEDNKFYLYEPAPITREFHSSLAKIRVALGGNRSSKTYSHITDYGIQFTGKVPKSLEGSIPPHRLNPHRRLRFCMDDYPNSFTKVVWPLVQQLIPSDSIKDVIKDSGRIKAIVNSSGGFLEFMQYDQKTSKFAGSSRHSIGYDEEPPEDVRDENLMRLADVDGEETFSLTPVSGALKYLYSKLFLLRGREVEKDWEFILDSKGSLIDAKEGILRDISFPEGNPDIHVFFACIFDNPAITKSSAVRILSLYPKDEAIVRGKGKFMFLSGLVYNMFSEPTHVIDSFDDWWKPETRSNYTLYIAIDPHPRTPHAVLFMVVDKNNTLYLVDELFLDTTASGLIEAINIKCRGKVPERIIIDPIAYTPDPSTKSCLAYDLIDKGLNNPMPKAASKSKSTGIILTKEILSGASSTYPTLFVTRNCTKFRSEIGTYAWDDWKKDTSNVKGDKQKPIDKDDHFMENLYRLILERPIHYGPYEDYEPSYFSFGEGKNLTTGY